MHEGHFQVYGPVPARCLLTAYPSVKNLLSSRAGFLYGSFCVMEVSWLVLMNWSASIALNHLQSYQPSVSLRS